MAQTLVAVNGVPMFGSPKTAKSNRSISLDADTVATLRAWRRQQLEERLLWPDYQDNDLVFARENGELTHPAHLYYAFGRDALAAGLPVIRFHDLRHSCATLALSAGVHVKVVSERLGHSSVSITLDRYSHSVPALEEEAATRIAGLILR